MKVEPYEKIWIWVSLAVLGIFLVAVGVSVFAAGIQLPGREGQVHPQMEAQAGLFAQPGVREVAPGRYEAYILAQTWSFTPNEIHIPAGSTVTFYLTSKDVIHGFMIEGTNVNLMVLPGQISKATARFDQPGTYLFICHEYCGLGHPAMSGTLIVE